MLIGISGLAGSGKDTVADMLVKSHGFVKVSFGDPLKRICQDVFEFTDDQLWGPSSSRNAPDERYLRIPGGEKRYDPMLPRTSITVAEYLTPRYALQKLGTEWGRDCYDSIWVDYVIRVHEKLQKGGCYYDVRSGLRSASYVDGPEVKAEVDVVIADVRFRNEVDGLRKAGAFLVRMVRPGAGLGGAAGAHVSETEQLSISDTEFDVVLNNNNGLLSELRKLVDEMMFRENGIGSLG